MKNLTPYQNMINDLIKRSSFYVISAYVQINGKGTNGEFVIFTKDEKMTFLKNVEILSKDCPDLFIGFEHLNNIY